jgi:hypothetical protein
MFHTAFLILGVKVGAHGAVLHDASAMLPQIQNREM